MTVRILIADDNAPVRKALRRVLEGAAPWEILEAENGEDCLRKACEYRPTLIVLDLAMPQMDGMRAARVLARILPSIPIIMHTLHYTPRVALEAMKSGVSRVVPKADRLTILTAIQELLESKRLAEADQNQTTGSDSTNLGTSSEPQAAGPPSPPSAAEPPHTTEKSLPGAAILPKA